MNMIAVDTHEEVQELKAAGFTGAQAEAVTRIVRKAQDIDLSSLAAKNDLPVTKADLQRDLANTKVEMLKRRVIGAIGIQMIVIFGAVIALTRTIPH
jgi:ethanolamine ammonia-lyase small subunit